MDKYYNKVSIWSRIVNIIIALSDMKEISSSEKYTKEYIMQIKNKKYNLPIKLGFIKSDLTFMDTYTFNGTLRDNKPKLIYIHGGSYIEHANKYQMNFAKELAEKLNYTLIFPVYPLAPHGNYKLMYELMDKLYNEMLGDDIVYLGDSAGGGFILSYSMYLRDNKKMLPKHLIMLSLWLDITLSNPKILKDAKNDNMCGIDGNRYDGKLWANGLDTKDPLVSPIYGKFNDLPEITLVVGGREILTSECHEFHEMLLKNKINHNFIKYKNQGHIFPVYPIKEKKLVIEDICSILIDRGELK